LAFDQSAFFTGAIGGGCRGSKEKGEYNVWQRRFWEHTLRDERDLQAHVDYIHYNPVKHGLVTRVGDWPYSSFHRFVRMGWLDADWAGDPNIPDDEAGE